MPTINASVISTTNDDHGTGLTVFTSPQAWADLCPVDLVAVDQIYEGRCYADGTGEYVGSAIGLANAPPGINCDATRFMHFTVAAGQSWIDHAGVATNERKYDATKGFGLRNTGGSYYRGLGGNAGFGTYYKVSRIQGKAPRAFVSNRTDGPMFIENCLFECDDASGSTSYISNSEGYVSRTLLICLAVPGGNVAVNVAYNSKLHGCTIVLPSDISNTGSKGVGTNYATSKLFNNAVFGFETAFNEIAAHADADADYNATDDAYAPGSHSLENLTYSDQFQNTTTASRDFRPKAGASIIGAGLHDPTNNATDILESTRANPPTIGAEEYVNTGSVFDDSASDTGKAAATAAVADVVLPGSASDTAKGQDTLASDLAAGGATSDLGKGQDAVATDLAAGGSVSDTGKAQDAAVGGVDVDAATTDTAKAQDSAVAGVAYDASITDGAKGQDSVTTDLAATGAIAETAKGADSPATDLAAGESISETAKAQDNTFVAGADVDADVTENAKGQDSTAPTVTAEASVSEQGKSADVVATYMVAGGAVSETAKGADSPATDLTAGAATTDTAKAQDSATGGADVDAAIADTAKGQDALQPDLSAGAQVSDVARAGEAIATDMQAGATVADQARGGDAALAGQNYDAAATDVARAGDGADGVIPDHVPCRERIVAAALARLQAIASLIPGVTIERERDTMLDDDCLPFLGLFEGDEGSAPGASGELLVMQSVRIEGVAAGVDRAAADLMAAVMRARVAQAFLTDGTLGGIARRTETVAEASLPLLMIRSAQPIARFSLDITIEYAIAEADPFTFAAEAA